VQQQIEEFQAAVAEIVGVPSPAIKKERLRRNPGLHDLYYLDIFGVGLNPHVSRGYAADACRLLAEADDLIQSRTSSSTRDLWTICFLKTIMTVMRVPYFKDTNANILKIKLSMFYISCDFESLLPPVDRLD
jgi:hypothetical protein